MWRNRRYAPFISNGSNSGFGSDHNRPYMSTSILRPATRNFSRSVPSSTKPARLAAAPDAGLFTDALALAVPAHAPSAPTQPRSPCLASSSRGRPRAVSVIQYQNQPVRLSSSMLTQTRPTNTSPSTTVHALSDKSCAISRPTYPSASSAVETSPWQTISGFEANAQSTAGASACRSRRRRTRRSLTRPSTA